MPAVTDFELREETATTSACLVVVRGDLDMYSSPAVRQRIANVIDKGIREIVVDLSETTFMDSSALGVLVGALKRLRPAGGRLLVVASTPRLARTLSITGLDQVFEVFSDRDTAVRALE